MFHLKQNDSFLTNRHKSMSEELINKSEEVAPENEAVPSQEMTEEVAPVAEEVVEATPEVTEEAVVEAVVETIAEVETAPEAQPEEPKVHTPRKPKEIENVYVL